MAISKQLVEMMGGKIGVDSEEGKGSTFSFNAILKKQQNYKDNCKGLLENKNNQKVLIVADYNLKKIPGGPKEKVHVLLVEDNKVNQKVAERILEKFGYISDIVSNGKEAINILEKKSYDIVLMDIQMPIMDGFEATRIIRDFESNVVDHAVPIIAMTAHAMKGDRDRCLEAGMDDYISKPMRPDELKEVIYRQLCRAA